MKFYNLLHLSSSNSVQLIESFKEAFKRLNLNGDVYTADIEKYCASSQVSKKHFVIPQSDSKEYFTEVKKIIKTNKISFILSERDDELVILSKNRKFFDELGCFLLVSDEETIALCRDKLKINDFFQKHNISHPKTNSYEEILKNPNIKFPLLCKPRIGSGSKGLLLAKNKDVIDNYIENKTEYIFQEYIEGEEFTIDVLTDFKGNILSIIPRKRILVKGGESFISITKKNDLIIEETKKICSLIRFLGHINIQCILKDKIPYFIEINPRFGGASKLAFKAGMDSPFNILRMLKGDNLDPFIGEFEENLMMLRYTQDFYVKPY